MGVKGHKKRSESDVGGDIGDTSEGVLSGRTQLQPMSSPHYHSVLDLSYGVKLQIRDSEAQCWRVKGLMSEDQRSEVGRGKIERATRGTRRRRTQCSI